MTKIRNFTIIAHVDHGKSTLADRMLELTGTIEKRKMREQALDQMELERERGITIKMTPVRMVYHAKNPNSKIQIPNKLQNPNSQSLEIGNCDLGFADSKYILNLIDTPGHIDFSYEVSRALKAVEGSLLLVDATQGVQAQTLTTLHMARESGLSIIPVISKKDSPLARVDEVKQEIINLLGCKEEEILETSGKTGFGVEKLLEEIVRRIPAPTYYNNPLNPPYNKGEIEGKPSLVVREGRVSYLDGVGVRLQALVFDFKYDPHRGVIVFVRIVSGSVSKNDRLLFKIVGEKFNALEAGVFSPEETPKERLEAGEIGYIVTGIKSPGIASVGDTVTTEKSPSPALAGYGVPKPVVWASIYPENQNDFVSLKQSLAKLKLSDSSFAYEEESSGTLGKGFRCGFLGMLHLEIITERLRREFNLGLVVTMPTITYEVELKSGQVQTVYSPSNFPDEGQVKMVLEPWVNVKIITPVKFLGALAQLAYEHEAEMGDSKNFGEERVEVEMQMPLRELMRNFFDQLKSATSGFASLSYEISGKKEADVVRLDILINEEAVPAFSRVVSRRIAEAEAEAAVKKLHEILPRQMIAVKIQAQALGRIISSKTLTAFRKDVTQHMYGGDITRKMKLREKQKKGKKKMQRLGSVNIPQEAFLKMMKLE